MTPKEKAEELIDKFKLNSRDLSFQNKYAKQCALIAVDEVLNVLPQSEYLEDRDEYYENRERLFWKQVKQEIGKL